MTSPYDFFQEPRSDIASLVPMERKEARPANDDLPEGLIDHLCRVAIRDLVRIDGFEKAREKIAMYLDAEAGKRMS